MDLNIHTEKFVKPNVSNLFFQVVRKFEFTLYPEYNNQPIISVDFVCLCVFTTFKCNLHNKFYIHTIFSCIKSVYIGAHTYSRKCLQPSSYAAAEEYLIGKLYSPVECGTYW